MTENVKIKNVWSEALAFTWYPLLNPGDEIEVSQAEAERLSLNDSIEIIGKKKTSSFKGVEPESN